jgi:hypothetical protein
MWKERLPTRTGRGRYGAGKKFKKCSRRALIDRFLAVGRDCAARLKESADHGELLDEYGLPQ